MRTPLLLLGATGTLGRAFQRVCEIRGLAVRCATRHDADLMQPLSIAALLDGVKPWAVINASGYVRVDDAERESEACFAVNTTAAVHVAAACEQRGVPLVSFSSDLVFDGTRDRPYTEGHQTRPLNVYGASKARAEQGILEVMPSALVIRTSAFFGPWDQHNFVVQTLRSIRDGRRAAAADDIVVSPTYVPDLVNASLDLLLDREAGLWHLANTGATTWFAFAQETAEACGERADLIDPVPASDLGWSAARPAYSALGSARGSVMRSREQALAAFAEQLDWRDVHRLSA